MASNNGRDKSGKLSALDRLIGQSIGQNRTIGLEDDPAKEKYPILWDWLTRTTAGRDHIKQPARLSVTMGPEGVICSLADADLAVALDCSCSTLEGVFGALEVALTQPNPPIRRWGKKEPTLRKRKAGN